MDEKWQVFAANMRQGMGNRNWVQVNSRTDSLSKRQVMGTSLSLVHQLKYVQNWPMRVVNRFKWLHSCSALLGVLIHGPQVANWRFDILGKIWVMLSFCRYPFQGFKTHTILHDIKEGYEIKKFDWKFYAFWTIDVLYSFITVNANI